MAWRKPANLREWLRILFRHRYKFFFAAVSMMIAVVLASRWIPPSYEAEAKFERHSDMTINMQGGAPILTKNLDPIRRAVQQDLKGRPNIEQLVEDLELTKSMPHGPDGELTPQGQLAKQELVKKLQAHLRVNFDIRSEQVDYISVAFSDSTPELVSKVVNRLVDNYIRATQQKLDETLISAKNFFDREATRYRAKTADLEGKKLAFEREHPGLLPDDPAGVQAKVVELRTQLAAVVDTLQKNTGERDQLKVWIKDQKETVEEKNFGENPVLTELKRRRSAAQADYDSHVYTLGQTPEHPAVIKITKQLADLDALIAATEKQAELSSVQKPNQARADAVVRVQSLEGMIVAGEQQRETLAGGLEQAESLDRNFIVIRNDYVKITHDLDEAQNQLKFWDDNLRRTTIALQAQIGSSGVRLSVLQYANEAVSPSSPTLAGILGLAVALGLGAGALLVVLCELLDHSFHTVEQAVDELKLPVLGAVNEIVTPAMALRRRVLALGVYPGVSAVMALVLLALISLTYLRLQDPHRYQQLVHEPTRFFKDALTGQS